MRHYVVTLQALRCLQSLLVTAAQVLLVKLLQQLAQPILRQGRVLIFAQAELHLFFSLDVNYDNSYLEAIAFAAISNHASCLA